MKDIILGTGDEHLDALIQEDILESQIGKVNRIVDRRKTLIEKVAEYSPDLIIVGEDLIGEGDDETSDEEWEFVIEEIRKFSLNLRIVFLCDRPSDDIFLTKLTTYNITDIFNEGKLPNGYIQQLADEPSFKNIEQFRKKIKHVQEEMQQEKQEQQEKEAESIMSKGTVPTNEEILTNQAPVYEQLMIRPQLIIFASAYEGAGSSTAARLFAEYLANLNLSVGVLESPYAKPYWFEALYGSSKVESENWKSWHRLIEEENEITKGSDLFTDKVTYLVKHPKEELKDWNLMKSAYLVGYARQIPILIYDLSHEIDEEKEKLILKQANHVVLTSGYDPVRINREMERYDRFLNMRSMEQMILLLNKSNETLKKKYSKDILNSYGFKDAKDMISLPYLENMTLSTIEGTSPWKSIEGEENKEYVEAEMEKLAIEVLSQELFDKLQPQEKKRKKLKIPFLS